MPDPEALREVAGEPDRETVQAAIDLAAVVVGAARRLQGAESQA